MALIVKTTGFENWAGPDGLVNIKVLLTGDHGVGKTPTAAEWPKPFFAACEPGLASIATKKVPYGDIKSVADMDAALELMRRNCAKPPAQREYQTFVIDTFDSYQRTIIQERLRTERKEALSGWADWGWLDGKMNQLIEQINNLPMNVLVLLHTKDVQDGDGDDSILVKKARLKGDIKDTLFQDFDFIGQAEKSYVAVKGERVLKRQIRWHSEPKFPFIRDRFNVLPKFTDITFTERDYTQIYDAILGAVDGLPESTVVEEVATAEDSAVTPAAANEQGGPVDKPNVPAAKKVAAKKATGAAKKAAASKADAAAAASKADAAKAQPSTPVETPAAKPAPTVTSNAEAEAPAEAPVEENVVDYEATVAAEAEAVEAAEPELSADAVAESLGAEVIEEAPAPEPRPEPVKQAAPAKAPTLCGDQPAGLAGKFAVPAQHCGKELSKENATRAQMALLKAKAYLCDSCLDEFKAAS